MCVDTYISLCAGQETASSVLLYPYLNIPVTCGCSLPESKFVLFQSNNQNRHQIPLSLLSSGLGLKEDINFLERNMIVDSQVWSF